MDNFLKLSLITLLFSLAIFTFQVGPTHAGSFYIDFANNTFVKDGQPFQYVSGSIHSYRVPRALWQDRLDKLWASGLNAIQIYIFWNEHEPHPGVYDFEGQNDVFAFIEMAQKTGFVVILRPGPYTCAEHEFGGLPWWLHSDPNTVVVPRTSDTVFMAAVTRWFNVFLPKIQPLLFKNGGPIISVQVENEYGSYYACDKKYLGALRDLFRANLGDDVVYFTTDPFHKYVLECGTVKDVYATVDFGTSTTAQIAFAAQREFAPKGPLVNSEFYPGWLDMWGLPHATVSTQSVIKTFVEQLDMKANVNFYMFHGGTNFGWSNGADPPYIPQPTSYDYDAPVSEAGDTTNKYLAIRNTIAKYLPIPKVPIPSNSSKKAYGKVQMQYHSPLIDTIVRNSDRCIKSTYPKTFEELGQGYGFILYTTTLSNPNVFGKVLSVPGIRDRGYVQIGPASVGYLARGTHTNLKINLQNNTNTTLYIIVENMGRLNFGNDLRDLKGILGDVTLDNVTLDTWTTCLTDNFIPNFQKSLKPGSQEDFIAEKPNSDLSAIDYAAPAIYQGTFDAANGNFDTFLKMDKFTKGVGFIRSTDTLTNLGRYWPHEGPQVTLYIPGVFATQAATNSIVLIEFQGSACADTTQCYVELLDYPMINGL